MRRAARQWTATAGGCCSRSRGPMAAGRQAARRSPALASLSHVASASFRRLTSRAGPAAAAAKLLGEPILREVCQPVGSEDLHEEKAALADALAAFRAAHGFGRGIAAPQIGVPRRFVALNLGGRPRVLSDPKIAWASEDTVTLWDDCMSLPWVLCRVRRHKSISVAFVNEDGHQEVWDRLPTSASELLQHEIDHLDGRLITDRMLECADDGHEVMVSREAYEAAPEVFDAMVDVHIAPCEYPTDVKILRRTE